VETVRILTKGLIIRDNHCIGAAIREATDSGYCIAMRLGTSSPRISDAKVMPTTTMAREISRAYGPITGRVATCGVSPATSDASPYAPLKMPISVMPTWIVERPAGAVGVRWRLRAAAAVFGEVLEADPARGNNCNFGHGEDAIDENQAQDDQYIHCGRIARPAADPWCRRNAIVPAKARDAGRGHLPSSPALLPEREGSLPSLSPGERDRG
jgi:hypothetical protein